MTHIDDHPVSTRTRRAAGGEERSSPPAARRTARVGYGYWWWALPSLLLMGVVLYATTATGAFFAFTDWTGLGSFAVTGVANFVSIFQTAALRGALVTTLVMAAGFFVATNVGGILLALSLNRGIKSRFVLRVLVFMPVVLSPIAVSFVWEYIFSYTGPLNEVLHDIGLSALATDWLANPAIAVAAIVFVAVWQNLGVAMVIYLAGLATVPIEAEEAAALDGASAWQRFRYIVLPLLRPSLAVAGTLTIVQGLRIFDQIMALTAGGPAGATETLATQVYKQSFLYGRFGYGAALALVLTVIILIFSIAQQAATRNRDTSES